MVFLQERLVTSHRSCFFTFTMILLLEFAEYTTQEKLLPSPVCSHVTFVRMDWALYAPHSGSSEGLLQRATNVPVLRSPLEVPLAIHLTFPPTH